MAAVEKSSMNYGGATVRIAKIRKSGMIIRGSVDGNRYGTSYDKTVSAGFSDKGLIKQGFREGTAGNGSTFYTFDNSCFAEGLEIAFGENHQEFSMSCVNAFNETMAVGFLHDEGLVFDKQINIMNNAGAYYGALTFAFGIMKDWNKCEWGKELSATRRNSIYENISGRTILGQNDEFVFHLSVYGVTGKSGLRGYQLFDLCNRLGMKDAGCFDGGGSVWQRVDGVYTNNTSRKVKNAFMIFYKEREEVKPEPEPEDPETSYNDLFLNVASVGVSIRESLKFDAKNKPCGFILETVKVGQKAKILEFVPGIQPDGYQWMKVKLGNIVGFSQLDSRCYWIA